MGHESLFLFISQNYIITYIMTVAYSVHPQNQAQLRMTKFMTVNIKKQKEKKQHNYSLYKYL